MPEKPEIKSVSLPEIPKGKEFEEFVLAYFQSAGLFTEKNIEEPNVLELDIVVTHYTTSVSKFRLVEVKSGGWGLADIFKVKGWMVYLGIERGMFVTVLPETGAKSYLNHIRVADSLGIELILSDMTNNTQPFSSDFTGAINGNELDISTWRFSYWIERKMLEKMVSKCKSEKDQKRFNSMRDYHYEINRDVFYSRNKASRLLKLYETFQKYPRLSSRCALEMSGGNFDDKEVLKISSEIYAKTFYECEYNDIQLSCLIEHKARLAILKNLVDYIQADEKRGGVGVSDDVFLPVSFKAAVTELKTHNYYYRYPIFWQWFLWVWGGFVLQDYTAQEYELFSQKTGIPVEEIPNALKAFDILFPVEGGWFIDLSKNSNILKLKMFPIPFHGLGAHYRKKFYTESDKYEDLKLGNSFTRNDLIKWNNTAVEVLS